LPPNEILRSERHTDGLWHARYDTALATLCSRPVLAKTAPGRPGRPTCLICRHTAHLIFRIDESAPAWWFKTSGGVACDSRPPLAPPEDVVKDAA
jgi:hypothetical protein